jgi:hypothetical protein
MSNDLFCLVYTHTSIHHCVGDAAVDAFNARPAVAPGEYAGNAFATRLSSVLDRTMDDAMACHHEDAMAEVADLIASSLVTQPPPWFLLDDHALIVPRILEDYRQRYSKEGTPG